MHLASRPATLNDFDEFYRSFFYADRENADLRAICAKEWRVLLMNSATISLVVEDRDRLPGERMVGCAQLAFVTDAFVAWARTGVSPQVYMQAVEPMPDGSWPLLNAEEVDRVNQGEGVNVLTTRWAWASPRFLSPEQERQVREYLTRACEPFYRGYRYKELLAMTYGEMARDFALRAGYLLRDDYERYFQRHPPAPPAESRPFLVGLTREEALASEGTLVSMIFVYSPPELNFTAEEQELLACALAKGIKNEDAARLLGVSLSTVKRRWENIYLRVSEKLPGLLPGSANDEEPPGNGSGSGSGGEDRRGQEKKRILLWYLSHHPEELRPFGRPVPAAD